MGLVAVEKSAGSKDPAPQEDPAPQLDEKSAGSEDPAPQKEPASRTDIWSCRVSRASADWPETRHATGTPGLIDSRAIAGPGSGAWDYLQGLGSYALKLAAGGFLLAVFETAIAKMRVFRVPEFLGAALMLGLLATLLLFVSRVA